MSAITRNMPKTARVFITASDHMTGLIGATLTVYLAKEGQAFSLITPTVVERGFGWYDISLTSLHTDTLGNLTVHVESSGGGDPAELTYTVTDYTDIANAIHTELTELTNLDASISSRLASASYTTPPTTLEITNGIWDELMASHLTIGTTGYALSQASSASLTPTEVANAVWDVQSTDHVLVGTTGLLLSQINANVSSVTVSQSTLTSLVNTLLKYERNRTRIDTTAATLTVYDDDCTTVLQVFNLKDHLGNPSIQEVCERSPTSCP